MIIINYGLKILKKFLLLKINVFYQIECLLNESFGGPVLLDGFKTSSTIDRNRNQWTFVGYSAIHFGGEYIFDSLPNITDENELARFDGHIMLADYFPYNQELIYKNSNRDSRYYRSENQPPNRENYALEKYSSESKCFDHGSIWEQYIEQCHKKRPVTPQAAGCYQFECISSKGIYVRIGKEKYLCEYQGQNLTIVTAEYDSIYVGTIICPDCHIICSSLNNF
ncbi:unnamed protein product [Rotaria sp. Silwood1]|nr:unnamed protein product [Rotaria sp. Silwood1]